MKGTILIIFTVLILSGCESAPPDGYIRVKNDSQDSTYNILEVSGGGGGASLKPGESTLMPKGTTTLYFSRAYADHTKRYTVNCPEKLTSGITLKLIDVYLNRMQGGCVLTSATH
jgi:hypothetical protein